MKWGELGLLQHLHGNFDVAGEDRAHHHIGIAVDRLLHLRTSNAGIRLGVVERQVDLLFQDAPLGIELLHSQDDTIAEIAAGHGDGAGYFTDIGELHVRGCPAA